MHGDTLKCPRCGGDLEPGHILDHSYGPNFAGQAKWQAGEPRPSSWWTGGVKIRRGELLPVTSYRCVGCGYLEMYARPEPEIGS